MRTPISTREVSIQLRLSTRLPQLPRSLRRAVDAQPSTPSSLEKEPVSLPSVLEMQSDVLTLCSSLQPPRSHCLRCQHNIHHGCYPYYDSLPNPFGLNPCGPIPCGSNSSGYNLPNPRCLHHPSHDRHPDEHHYCLWRYFDLRPCWHAYRRRCYNSGQECYHGCLPMYVFFSLLLLTWASLKDQCSRSLAAKDRNMVVSEFENVESIS